VVAPSGIGLRTIRNATQPPFECPRAATPSGRAILRRQSGAPISVAALSFASMKAPSVQPQSDSSWPVSDAFSAERPRTGLLILRA